MALSLIKGPVVNNASGNVQLNCLLYGMFEVRQVANICIVTPTSIGNGQSIAIRIVQDSATGYDITWSSAFEPTSALTSGHMGEGYSWIGFFIFDEGKLYCMSSAQSDTPE